MSDISGDAFFENTRERHYRLAEEPVLRADDSLPATPRLNLLLHMHAESIGVWRQLVDVRFKLLGLVPAVSILALGQLVGLDPATGSGDRWARAALAALGFVLVAALWIYDARNNTLHNDLISRIRRAEAELGVHTGIALGRKNPVGLVKHGTATTLAYATTALAWVAGFVTLVVHAADGM